MDEPDMVAQFMGTPSVVQTSLIAASMSARDLPEGDRGTAAVLLRRLREMPGLNSAVIDYLGCCEDLLTCTYIATFNTGQPTEHD